MTNDLALLGAIGSASLREGVVVGVEPDGGVLVAYETGGETILCDRLDVGGARPLMVAPRDRVLVWQANARSSHGVVLGRIGISHADAPDELLLEAKHELTLRVGEGSITMREDGRILIKGKDLVSHAQRMNRIKGGAVSIN